MKKPIRAGAGILAVAMLLGGCAANSEEPETPSAEEPAAGPIDFWYFGSTETTQPAIDRWNELNPDMPVTGTNPGSGTEYQAKLIAANKAGNPPDAAALQYQDVPSFVINGTLEDLTSYFGQYEDEFLPGAWGSVEFDDKVYALPADVSPMLMYYRKDIFKEHGVAVPTTWDEFAEAAETLKAAEPDAYITNVSPAAPNTNWIQALAGQMNSNWWSIDGDTWNVGIADEGGKQVAEYWGDLASRDLVDTMKERSPEWNAAYANGTLLTLIGATWSNTFLSGAAPDTKGSWGVAPLPQWDPENPNNAYYGGSSTTIPANADNKAGAAEFIHWLNADQEALEYRLSLAASYFTTKDSRNLAGYDTPPEFLSDVDNFWQLADESAAISTPTQWGPNALVAYTAYETYFGPAMLNDTSWVEALEAVQADTIANMEKQGFNVEPAK